MPTSSFLQRCPVGLFPREPAQMMQHNESKWSKKRSGLSMLSLCGLLFGVALFISSCRLTLAPVPLRNLVEQTSLKYFVSSVAVWEGWRENGLVCLSLSEAWSGAVHSGSCDLSFCFIYLFIHWFLEVYHWSDTASSEDAGLKVQPSVCGELCGVQIWSGPQPPPVRV